MEKVFKIKSAGDCAIAVEFENDISEVINNQVAILKEALKNAHIKGVLECIPTYRSLLIRYNPLVLSFDALASEIKRFMSSQGAVGSAEAKVYIIPVYYGDEYGPDLENVASTNELSKDEVIKIHTSTDYRIYMLGFTPGFPYLGGMDEAIATPRLSQPRTKIHAGSVGIAGKQTGVYPIDSPGGWQIIGRTPLKLFDIGRDEPILLEAGNYIRFKAVDLASYKIIEKQVAEGIYTCETETITRGGA